MIRVLLAQIALFLMPFVGFILYRFLTEGWAGVRVTQWSRVRFWLILSGVLLALGGLVYFALTGSEETGVFVPAQIINGELVPGHFRSP